MISKQSADVALMIEAGQDMSRFLLLEPQLRSEVDTLVREYSESLSVEPCSLSSPDAGYLLHLRLLEASAFAQFLDCTGFGQTRMRAEEWICFLAIDSWYEIIRHKWVYEFSKAYKKDA